MNAKILFLQLFRAKRGLSPLALDYGADEIKLPQKAPMRRLPAHVGFGIITAMSDDNDFFWFLAGCAAGDQTRRLRPRNRWDVVAYTVATVCVIVALVIAMR